MLTIAGFPQVAGAGTTTSDKGRDNSRQAEAAANKEAAPGQEKKVAPAADESQASAGTPTAADYPEDFSNHDADNGPGGQVCDGDPNNEPGAGGNYENTCPAGPSQNGAGDGEANGKPCAGCVGNADDKNPQGQATSGPSDTNNGYECDQKGRSANEGNNGIGYGNPAHTGCTSTPPPPPPPETCPDGSPMPANGKCGGELCPDGSAMPASGKCGGDTCPDGSAMPANGKCGEEPPCVPADGSVCGQETPSCVASADNNRCGGAAAVLGETLGRPVEVMGVTINAPAVAAAGLARTGSDLQGLAQTALLLVLGGVALLATAKVRRRDAAIDVSSRIG